MAGTSFTTEVQKAVINGINVEFTDDSQKRKLTRILNKLKKIPTGQKALADMAANKTVVALDNISGWGAFFPKNNRILLAREAPVTKLFSTLVHEARHMMQHQCGCGRYTRDSLDIQSQIMLDRAKEADAQMTALTACFEWAQSGDQKPFQMFTEKTPQIYDYYFAQKKKRRFKDNTNTAKTEIFKGWYEQDRIRQGYEISYMGRSAARELIQTVEKGKKGNIYTGARERKNLTPQQVLALIGADYMKDPEFLVSDKALGVLRSTKELLSLAFEANGRKDETLDKLPFVKTLVSMTDIHPITDGSLFDAQYRCEQKVSQALGLRSSDDKKAFFDQPLAEQEQAVAHEDKEVRDAVQCAHVFRSAREMFFCLSRLSKEEASLKHTENPLTREQANERITAEKKKMNECRKTVVDFARKRVPLSVVLKRSAGRI